MKTNFIAILFLSLFSITCLAQNSDGKNSGYSGNPVFKGWYADPEGIIFDDQYWIYPTYSDHYKGIDSSCFN